MNGYNIDSGGKGGSSCRSVETRDKISKAAFGRTHSEESKMKMSVSRSGINNHMYGKKRPKEFCDAMSTRQKGIPTGRKHTQETKDYLSSKSKERMSSPEEKIRASEMGKSNKGRKHKPKSEETRKKLSDANMGVARPTVECPHCGKIGGVGSMHQWHFNKCKLRFPLPIDDINQLTLT